MGSAELSGKVTRRLSRSPPHAIELWDNHGIVNTASMLWPRGQNVLVPGDSCFGEKIFKEVWNEIFDFCVGRA
jgi:hypothetical protein